LEALSKEILSRLAGPRFPNPTWDVIYREPKQEIIKTAFENGINMFDTAEEYSKGKSEEEM
jgi:aryl-alcohol dehydrogenase-like predicted oxidoreductase